MILRDILDQHTDKAFPSDTVAYLHSVDVDGDSSCHGRRGSIFAASG